MPNDALAGLSVLIVEDEALLRKQIASQLEALGADVTAAGTLQAARQFMAELSFDFALLDVNLPDGQSTVLLQEKSFPAGTGVIVMTADGAVSGAVRSEEHTSELQSLRHLVCRLLLEKKKTLKA